MIKKCIRVTSHALYPPPLSQTVTPTRTPSPSSVTYFMDGPYAPMCMLDIHLYAAYVCLLVSLHEGLKKELNSHKDGYVIVVSCRQDDIKTMRAYRVFSFHHVALSITRTRNEARDPKHEGL